MGIQRLHNGAGRTWLDQQGRRPAGIAQHGIECDHVAQGEPHATQGQRQGWVGPGRQAGAGAGIFQQAGEAHRAQLAQ